MWANLEGGDRHWGDILIGADGIWSKTRTQLVGPGKPSYSNYTCYTGIADYVCADIDTVGYRVFLGNKQYFVSSDVGGGKMQWYAFHKEAADGVDPEGGSKQRLMEIFGHWCALTASAARRAHCLCSCCLEVGVLPSSATRGSLVVHRCAPFHCTGVCPDACQLPALLVWGLECCCPCA